MSREEPEAGRPVFHTLAVFAAMIGVLAFANWKASGGPGSLGAVIAAWKWWLVALSALGLAAILVRWFSVAWWRIAIAGALVALVAALGKGGPVAPFLVGVAGVSVVALSRRGETREWIGGSWDFAKDILPLLLAGILIVGFLLGRPGYQGLIPQSWEEQLVGGNSLRSTFVATVASGLMYFCTLTEVPIVQGLMGAGMGKGPALAFLLAGPAVSLPNILILRSIVGTRKTLVYLALVIVMATLTGSIFGAVAG
jgi:uncharacterized membrane protein YraQ (UPF0718 family)